MSYAVQKRDGTELNRFYKDDLPIHDWYRFVLSYPPHLVRDYLHKFGIKKNHCVLDPFCGTGTTLVECKKRGIHSIGIEANPIASLAAKTKTSWNVNASELVAHAEKIAKKTNIKLSQVNDTYKELPEKSQLAPFLCINH
jgi:DNA modification methylase